MRLSNLSAVVAASLLSLASAAHADTIAGLFETGVDANRNRLAGGALDPHYTIVETGLPAIVYYNGAWQGPPVPANWVSVSGDGRAQPPRTYRTTFDLTGYDPSSVVLSGAWAVDNFGYMYLNGASTGFNLDGNGGGNFLSFHAFSIDSGFVAGVNTLDFYVVDAGEITGLAVVDLQLAGDVQTPGAPEPASWTLAIVGFGAVGAALRRRRPALA